MALTGNDELNVKVPANDDDALNGASVTNADSLLLAAIVVAAAPEFVPFASVKKKEILAGESYGFAMAPPVFTAASISA